jgi:hypothetical protein
MGDSPAPAAVLAANDVQQEEWELRPATLADMPALGALYAAAFASNPAYCWIFSGAPGRPAPPGALRWLFERRAWLLLQQRCQLLVATRRPGGCSGSSTTDGGSDLAAAGCITPLDRKPSMWHFLRAGILAWPLWWGLASLRRALCLDGGLLQLLGPGGALHGHNIRGELVLMAVCPSCQVGCLPC